MSKTSSITLGPGEIVRLALDGRLRIPRFQRSFVWDNHDIAALLDSIWKGYPIGTLLLWRQRQPAKDLAFGSVAIPAPATDNAYVVVDGQQRLTTLVGALAPGPSFPPDPRFEVFFDLRTGRFAHAGRQRHVPEFWLPVRVSLESRSLLGWLRDKEDALGTVELETADAMAGAIRDYKIPAYVIEQDDEDLLRDVFDRVNSAGKPINRAQVFHALFGGGSGTSAAAVVAELRHEGFGDLEEQRVVQSLLAVRGGDVGRDLHSEFDAKEDRPAWFDMTTQALSRAVRFLQRLGVPHVELVPSALPIPVLAAFYHVHPEPDPYNEGLLARWVWRGWAHGYGRAGQTPALRQAVRAINPAKLAPDRAPPEFDAVRTLLDAVADNVPPAQLDGFNASSAAGRLALLALAELGPRRPNGDLLVLPELFAREGTGAVAVLAGEHGSRLGARGLWDPRDSRLSGREGREVLASHLIDENSAALLTRRDVGAFVDNRGRAVKQLVDDFLARKLEPGMKTVPPLEEFWVPDPS